LLDVLAMASPLENMALRIAAAEEPSMDVDPWSAAELVRGELDGALKDLSTLSSAAFYGLIQQQAYTDMSRRVAKAAVSCRQDLMTARREMDRILSSVATEFLRKKRENHCCGG
jgi:hypothetical protein